MSSSTAIPFVLTHLNSEITLDTLATVYTQEEVEQITADARAVILVTETQAKEIFKFRTDAADVIDADESDIEFYTYDDAFNALAINPANAMMNVEGLSTNAIALADKLGVAYPANKCLVAHDFVRHLAQDLFGSYIGVDILNNEADLLANLRLKCGDTEEGAVMTVIKAAVKKVSVNSEEADMPGEAGAKYMTNSNAGADNLCRVLFSQMIDTEPARFANLDGTSSDTEPRPLPFFPGDSLNFKVIINAALGQHEFIRGADGEPVAPRSYEIRLQIVADDDSRENTVVADDEAVSAPPAAP